MKLGVNGEGVDNVRMLERVDLQLYQQCWASLDWSLRRLYHCNIGLLNRDLLLKKLLAAATRPSQSGAKSECVQQLYVSIE